MCVCVCIGVYVCAQRSPRVADMCKESSVCQVCQHPCAEDEHFHCRWYVYVCVYVCMYVCVCVWYVCVCVPVKEKLLELDSNIVLTTKAKRTH